MGLIKNIHELWSFHRDRSSRLVLAALEVALESVRPATLLKHAILTNERLSVRDINGKITSLPHFDRIYVIGAGKAAASMAYSLSQIVPHRIAHGAITIPYGVRAKIKGISITHASHPVPSRAGIEGTKKIINILKKVQENDLVFVLISGGASALMPLPANGISLTDKQKITNLLLRSGATIHEINTVRKHLSAVKGGQILQYFSSSCTVVSLILSDVIGDDLETIASGPTCPDRSTFVDALEILKKYHIRQPDAALAHIAMGAKGYLKETPKPLDPLFSHVHNVLIGNNTIACMSAARHLKKQGMAVLHLGSDFDGEAKDFGKFLANVASELIDRRPFAIVVGGETIVRLNRSRNGIGGRNQEAALSFLAGCEWHDVSAAFIGTDGIDGNSNAAGALISQNAAALADRLDLKRYLVNHDSYHALKKLKSLIITGYTGTNVNDIAVICGCPLRNQKKSWRIGKRC